MGTRHLDSLFDPTSIVVIGASMRSQSLGGMVLRNLLGMHYPGRLVCVNERGYEEVNGVPCFRRIRHLDFIPQLAIVCTPPQSVPALVRDLGHHGTRMVLVLTGGLSRTRSRSGRPLMHSLGEIAREAGVRVLGPETVGMMVPERQLNATYMHMSCAPGKIAYIGQSGTLASAVIDWARYRDVGFSLLTTLGDGLDIHVDDLIDYIAQDPQTRAILLQIESVREARRFVSAVRAVSRAKPVIVVKSGRYTESQYQTRQLPPGLNSSDQVYDAVFRRAGVLRVEGLDDMFDALETMTRMRPFNQESLHILSNGFGPAVLAVDALLAENGRLGSLEETTLDALAKLLPDHWTRRNPIDLTHSATPQTYTRAIEILEQDRQVENLLILFAPTLTEDSLQIADAVIQSGRNSRLNLFVCWMGQSTVEDARAAFFAAGVPSYGTPEKAIRAIMQMINHNRGQQVLRETPPKLGVQVADAAAARSIVTTALARDAKFLEPAESLDLLRHYGLEVAETHFVASVDALTPRPGSPEDSRRWSLRILHGRGRVPFEDQTATDYGFMGVAHRLRDDSAITEAARELLRELSRQFPDSEFAGFALQPSPALEGIEFSLGITRDPVFGPLIVCGAGGNRLNRRTDRKVGLPPLNMVLAKDLIAQSYMSGVVYETRAQAEAEAGIDALARALVALSQIVVDHPEIETLEIEPWFLGAGANEGQVLFARVQLGRTGRMSIQPYPEDLKERILLPKSRRQALIRPVRGEDEPAHIAFHQQLSPESIRYRYFHYRKSFTHDEMVRMLQLDYDREMAFSAVLVPEESQGKPAEAPQEPESDASESGSEDSERILGVVRTWTDPDNLQCEFAVIVADDMRGERLGWTLMRKMIDYSTDRGTIEMMGTVLTDNAPMLRLAEKLGFDSEYDPVEDVMRLRLQLNPPAPWQAEVLERRRSSGKAVG